MVCYFFLCIVNYELKHLLAAGAFGTFLWSVDHFNECVDTEKGVLCIAFGYYRFELQETLKALEPPKTKKMRPTKVQYDAAFAEDDMIQPY